MIVDDTADVEQRAGFKFAHLTHKFIGLFGKGLTALFVHIEPIGGFERVLQILFKLIDRANPLLYSVGNNGAVHFACPQLHSFYEICRQPGIA